MDGHLQIYCGSRDVGLGLLQDTMYHEMLCVSFEVFIKAYI